MRNRDARLYIQDILEAIQNIEEYMDGSTFDQFTQDKKTVDMVVQQLRCNR